MNRLPDPTQPTSPQAGQPTHNIDAVADALMQAVNQAITDDQTQPYPTAYRDPTPPPTIGAAPPVPQPGRTAMSQRASDISGLILSIGIASPLIGGGTALALWGTGQANPTVIAWIVGGAVALVVASTAFLKSAKTVAEAAPPVIHQHFTGTVHQDHSRHHSDTHGLIAKTHNHPTR